MNTSAKNLTEGPLGKQILLFSLPLAMSNLLQVLFNMSDLAVVGRFAGAEALGAVGSTTIFVTLFTSFLIGLGNGVNVLVARHFGAQQEKDVVRTVHSAALVCLLTGLGMTLCGLVFSPALLRLLDTKPELMAGAVLYLRIYFLGMPALALYNFGSAVFSAVGDTRHPLYVLTAAGVLNVLLNLLFVIGFQMDVAGVACASVLAQYFSAVLVVAALFRDGGCYGLRWRQLRLYKGPTRKILSLGLPAGFQTAVFYVANLFVQAGVNSFDTVVVEGNAAATNTDALVFDVMAAFYMACSSFMGQNYGAGKKDRVRRSYLISLAYSVGVGVVMGGGLVLFGRQFLGLFTTESAVIDEGMKRLVIMGLNYPITAVMDCTIAASRGLGKTVVPTVIVLLGSCTLRVVWVYTIFAWFHTIPVLYLVYPCSWTVTAIAEVSYFIHSYRKLYPQPAQAGR